VAVCPEEALGVWKLKSCAGECKSSVIVFYTGHVVFFVMKL